MEGLREWVNGEVKYLCDQPRPLSKWMDGCLWAFEAMKRKLDALPASVPVPESDADDSLRQRVEATLQAVKECELRSSSSSALHEGRDATRSQYYLGRYDSYHETASRLKEDLKVAPAPSPVPEEPEGENYRKTARRLAMEKVDRGELLAEFDAWLSFRPEFSEVLTAFREAFGTDTSADGAPVPVEEPEQKPIHEARPDLDLAAQQVKDEYIERALKVYELAVAPAPEIKPGQVWVSKEHGYKTTIERVEGDDIWLVEGDKPTRVDGQPHAVRDAFLAAWDLVSEPTPATPEIKVGQYWAKAGDIGADVWRVVGAFSGVEGERVRLRNVVDSWLSLSGEMLRRDYRLVSDPDPSPAPSLNPEGLLRWLDGEINQLLHDGAMGNLTPAAKRRLEVMQEVRSRLVSEEAENDER